MKSGIQPNSCNAQPAKPSRLHRWLLGITIALEAVWVVLLVAMALAR
jgi:hypothetical protein